MNTDFNIDVFCEPRNFILKHDLPSARHCVEKKKILSP